VYAFFVVFYLAMPIYILRKGNLSEQRTTLHRFNQEAKKGLSLYNCLALYGASGIVRSSEREVSVSQISCCVYALVIEV
jgi:hypothetical protein